MLLLKELKLFSFKWRFKLATNCMPSWACAESKQQQQQPHKISNDTLSNLSMIKKVYTNMQINRVKLTWQTPKSGKQFSYVCLNMQISVNIKVRDTKVGMSIAAYYRQLKSLSYIRYHAHYTSKSLIFVYKNSAYADIFQLPYTRS